ncbi:3-oxoacyl-[acyl-carrier-protein] synthase III C-terminal domain-containing protein [Streptomyces sp. B1866]|uniref:3-oxoacyl-ACP synthase III family protein n=1 Tax=Streptomyces sp. B1866 TaxID=3075431 RepID=UPI00289241E5|nr:3-oxoacyl-[acyl-carrier-protein] synthase III C-terminal domain-containing protein [Streptomyces sp. B1866]MDT3395874.1 3-oxoacyl-[acyl-carrier-protein] synthase III C-terminal domain-containing protein [Streptomyces sp. B1866]
MTAIHIVGTGGYQPGDPIPTSEIARLAGPLPQEVLEGLSIERRFWMIDPKTGEHRENNSDMAYKAAVRALEAAGAEPGDVDLMILATGTPDYPLPPLVNLVQDRLGLTRCSTLEIRSGGAGVVQALDIARMYLSAGTHRTALVIGSEAISPVLAPVFLGRDPQSIRMRDRMPLYMFGDGAGAMVLRASDAPGGLMPAASACVGGGRKPGIHSVGGGTHAPIHEQLKARRLVDLRVDVVGAGDFTPVMVTEAVDAALERAGVSVDTLDLCLVPEGNVGWMLDSLREAGLDTGAWKALDGKVVDSLATMGAVGCAAVPLFLDDAWRTGRVRPGDRILLVGVESTKWIYAGAVVDWTAPAPS